MNTAPLNMYISMSYTWFTRRNMLFVFLWLRPRNTWIPNQHVGCAGLVARHGYQKINRSHTNTDRNQHPQHRRTHTKEQHPKPPNEQLPQTLNNARRHGCEDMAWTGRAGLAARHGVQKQNEHRWRLSRPWGEVARYISIRVGVCTF